MDAFVVILFFKIAAVENRQFWKIDITGAYLHALMNYKAFMIIPPEVVAILRVLDPSCNPFIKMNGTIDTKPLRALYGGRHLVFFGTL